MASMRYRKKCRSKEKSKSHSINSQTGSDHRPRCAQEVVEGAGAPDHLPTFCTKRNTSSRKILTAFKIRAMT